MVKFVIKASLGKTTLKVVSAASLAGLATRLVTKVVANLYCMSDSMCRE